MKTRAITVAFVFLAALGVWLLLADRRHEAASPKRAEPALPATASGVSTEKRVPQDKVSEASVVRRPAAYVLGQNGVAVVGDIPEGRFRDRLSSLAPAARSRALRQLSDLRVPLNDVHSLDVDQDGRLFYQCAIPDTGHVKGGLLTQLAAARAQAANRSESPLIQPAAVPLANPPVRHSRPGAGKVIYLDFNGHSITGTIWNNAKGTEGQPDYRPAVTTYVAKPFDADGDANTFSDAEQTVIIRVWERIAEDYKAFDVDVTTEEPASFTSTTGRILITQSVDANGVNMPSNDAAGVAYLDVFGDPAYVTSYSPALIYADNLSNYHDFIAEAASHEMGHNLGLSHDGTTPVSEENEYYDGHGTGETSWGPIMGASYDRNVTQWSKGEYTNASNTQDDLSILAGHLGYVGDDHADSNGAATALTIDGNNLSGAGMIGATGEGDRFAFTVGGGTLSITASPFRSAQYTHGGNLDVVLELRNSADSIMASTPASDEVTGATLTTTVTAGTYYLRVSGTGAGNPQGTPPTGYTNYGSLGQYTLSGTITTSSPSAPSITGHPSNQFVYAGQIAQFNASASGNPAPAFRWQRLPSGGSVWTDLSDSGTYSGSGTATLYVATALPMNGDQFRCVASNNAGSAVSSHATLSVTEATTSVVSVAGGESYTMTVRSGGTLWANGNGYLGDGVTTSSFTPILVAANVVSVASAAGHTLFVRNDGSLWGFGSNTYNQLGDGSPIHTDRPVPLQVASNVAMVSTGYYHTMFVKTDKSLWATGSNFAGQLADGSTVSRDAPIQVATNVASVSVGIGHTAFLKTDGTLWTVGDNSWGQLGAGNSDSIIYTPVQIASDVAAVAAGHRHTLFIKKDGTLWATGQNSSGQLGDGTTTDRSSAVMVASGVKSVSAAGGHTLIIKTDNTLWATGAGASGQLGLGDTDGRTTFSQVAANVTSATAGYGNTMFVLANGTLWATGENYYGKLGDGTNTQRNRPVQVLPLAVGSPSVVVQPGDRAVATGLPARFIIMANGTPDLTYQWQRMAAGDASWVNLVDGGAYAGVSTPLLSISATNLAMSGDQFRCIVSNTSGTIPSNASGLTVLNLTEAQVGRLTKLYLRMLLRDGTASELATAGASLSANTQTLAGLYQNLLQSAEYLAREKERAIRLYYATFSRMPDQGGLYYWAAVLGGGSMTPTQVATAFAQSQEFLDTYGNLGNEAYITQLYRNTLGRDPDAGGLAYWVGQMNAGLTRGQMLLAFADSQEFTDRMAPEIEVVRLYHLLFDRMPTTQEYLNWRGFVRGYDQTETILSSTEFNTLHPSGLTNAQYAQAVFQGFLLRAADQGTQDTFSTQLGNGSLTRADLVHQMIDSGEFRTTVVPVTRHYLSVFLRAPDLVGSTHWTNQMRAGLGFTQLSQVFANSAEFASSYAGLTDTQFVSQMYLNILGRPADTGGLNHWVNLFATGQSDEAGLLLSFVLSWEAGWRFAPDIRTIGHYQAFYGRSPTNTELIFWKDYITSLPAQFRQELLESAEFTNSP